MKKLFLPILLAAAYSLPAFSIDNVSANQSKGDVSNMVFVTGGRTD